jgi:hypothetical protein
VASVKEHNNIINVVFDGNKHLKHVLSDQEIVQMCLIEGRFPLTKLPVCGHCEMLGLWHTDSLTKKIIGVCRSCGAITKHPVSYSTYLASKQDVDETGDTFRRMAMVDKKKDVWNRFIYLPEFDTNGRMIEDGSKTEQAKRYQKKFEKSSNLQR